jgi:hypothetical protein
LFLNVRLYRGNWHAHLILGRVYFILANYISHLLAVRTLSVLDDALVDDGL